MRVLVTCLLFSFSLSTFASAFKHKVQLKESKKMTEALARVDSLTPGIGESFHADLVRRGGKEMGLEEFFELFETLFAKHASQLKFELPPIEGESIDDIRSSEVKDVISHWQKVDPEFYFCEYFVAYLQAIFSDWKSDSGEFFRSSYISYLSKKAKALDPSLVFLCLETTKSLLKLSPKWTLFSNYNYPQIIRQLCTSQPDRSTIVIRFFALSCQQDEFIEDM